MNFKQWEKLAVESGIELMADCTEAQWYLVDQSAPLGTGGEFRASGWDAEEFPGAEWLEPNRVGKVGELTGIVRMFPPIRTIGVPARITIELRRVIAHTDGAGIVVSDIDDARDATIAYTVLGGLAVRR